MRRPRHEFRFIDWSGRPVALILPQVGLRMPVGRLRTE